MKNKTLVISAVAVLIAISSLGATYAFQSQQWPRNLDNTTREAIAEAFKTNDYSALQKAIKWKNLFPNMTEKRFTEATTRRAKRQTQRKEREQNREETKKTLENKDFAARSKIAQDKMTEIITTEEQFTKLIEMHKHIEAAEQIREELWLPEMRHNYKNKKNIGNRERNIKRKTRQRHNKE